MRSIIAAATITATAAAGASGFAAPALADTGDPGEGERQVPAQSVEHHVCYESGGVSHSQPAVSAAADGPRACQGAGASVGEDDTTSAWSEGEIGPPALRELDADPDGPIDGLPDTGEPGDPGDPGDPDESPEPEEVVREAVERVVGLVTGLVPDEGDVPPAEVDPGDGDPGDPGDGDGSDHSGAYRELVEAAGGEVHEDEVCDGRHDGYQASDGEYATDYLLEEWAYEYAATCWADDYLLGDYVRNALLGWVDAVTDDRFRDVTDAGRSAIDELGAVTDELPGQLPRPGSDDPGEQPQLPELPPVPEVPDAMELLEGTVQRIESEVG